MNANTDDPWLRYYHEILLGRLVSMPVGYAFNVQNMAWDLGEVCMRLAIIISGETRNQHVITLLGQDLFRITLRAIVIGVFGLAYHGWGFNAGCPREEVVALLNHLRSQGPLSRRDLQRKFAALTPIKRDKVLARLEFEGLIECRDNEVSAVPLSDYIERLQELTLFPKTGALSALLLGKKCPLADPVPGMKVEKPRQRRKSKDNKKGDAPAEAPERVCLA